MNLGLCSTAPRPAARALTTRLDGGDYGSRNSYRSAESVCCSLRASSGAVLRTPHELLASGMASLALVGGFIIAAKSAPALKTLVITVGSGAAELPGQLVGNKLSEQVKAYLCWRPGADEATIRDQIAAFGLQSAQDYVRQFDTSKDPADLARAQDKLIDARDQLKQANVVNDRTMWLHCLRVYNLLIVVSYYVGSRMGQDPPAGLRFAKPFLGETHEPRGRTRHLALTVALIDG